MHNLVHFFCFYSNNSRMQWYYVLLISVFVVALLLTFPLKIGLSSYINLRENLGAVLCTFYGFTVLCFQFKLNKTAITIIKRKGEDKDIPINIIDKDVIFMEYFIKSVFRYIGLNKISVYFMVGSNNNAFAPAIIGGVYKSLMYSIFAYLFTKKGEFPAYIGLETENTQDMLKLAGECKVIFSLWIILYGYLRAKKLTKRWLIIYERISRQERKSNRANS